MQKSWQNFKEFWDSFFNILPWEVLLLLLFSVILLSLFNSLSPQTPKANLTVAIVILSALWIYFWSLFAKEVSYSKVIQTALYILVPLHSLGLVQLLLHFAKKYYWKKRRTNPKDWESALFQLGHDYHTFASLAHQSFQNAAENRDVLKGELAKMEQSLSGLKRLLEGNGK